MEGPLKRKTLLKEGRKRKVNRKEKKIVYIFFIIFFHICQYSVYKDNYAFALKLCLHDIYASRNCTYGQRWQHADHIFLRG